MGKHQREAGRDVPLELAETARTDDQHSRVVMIDDIEKHMAGILCVPSLTRDGDM